LIARLYKGKFVKNKKVMKTLFTLSLLFIHLLLNYNSYSQIKNGSFEMWDTTFVATAWSTSSPYGVFRTTDAYAGNYSLVIHNWYTYANTILTYKDTTSARPFYISGHYKLDNEGTMPTAYAQVLLKKNNGDTVAYANYLFDTAAVYTPFELQFNYLSSATPDSVVIVLKNSERACTLSNVCNLLYLDDIKFNDYSITDVDEITGQELQVFPNPATDILYIKGTINEFEIIIYNLQGQIVKTSQNVKTIVISDLTAGIYFIHIKTGRNKSAAVIDKLIVY
jgi:hypothetical protein